MEFFLEPFALGIQQRALVAALIAALMASQVGVWLVLRGMSFFGDAFVHGVLPGIAAAIVFDFSPLAGAALAALVMVAGVELVHRQTVLKEDTAIGLLFVGMLALGVLIISTTSAYTGSLTSILFGDPLGVTWSDIAEEAIIAGIVTVAAIVLHRPLLTLSFNANKARSLGMRPGMVHAAMLAMVALAVIGSFRTTGTLLVFGLMIGPPATAALLVRTTRQMVLVSLAISAASMWLGLIISYHANTAASATMAVLPVAGFFAVLGAQWLLRGRRAQEAV